MTKQSTFLRNIIGVILCLVVANSTTAQIENFASTPAVSGYEQELAKSIKAVLRDFTPKTDNLGNVYVTVGTGKPHRLIVAPMDEPGYVVSEITPDGYLRVQRLPQRAPNAVFDLLHAAQPVWVVTRDGKKISGVFTGLSVHLEPARQNIPTMAHPDEMFVDIGASSAEEVREAGVDLLDPIALARVPQRLGAEEVASPAIGDRFGCAALAELLGMLHANKANISGTLTVAFAAQQWTGGRGLDRLLNELHPDEMIYVGRLMPPRTEGAKTGAEGAAKKSETRPGGGVLVGTADASAALTGLAADLKKLGDEHHVTVTAVNAAAPTMAGYAKPTQLPERFVHLGIASLYPVTPAETVSIADISALEMLLYRYVAGSGPGVGGGMGGGLEGGYSEIPVIQTLTETYGASGHEENVREQVKKLLPCLGKDRNRCRRKRHFKMGKREGELKRAENCFRCAHG